MHLFYFAKNNNNNISDMTKYIEYTKGGDILIAPSLSYKHQYVLKCDLCEDYFGELEHFLSHYLGHYEMVSSEEDDKLSQPGSSAEQSYQAFDYSEDDYGVAEGIKEAGVDAKAAIESKQKVIEIEERVATIIEDSDGNLSNSNNENINFKDVSTNFEDTDMNYSLIEIENEGLELSQGDSKADEEQLNSAEHPRNALTKKISFAEDKANLEFFQKLMNCKEDVVELIAAYKKEAHLWDFNYNIKNRKIENRITTWNNIANHLKQNRNLDIDGNQVAACIFYLRQRFREQKRLFQYPTKYGNETFPMWAYKKLHFLNQFVETNPIGLLDIHQDLAPKQTIQVLKIFERCVNLWDSNKIGYYCTNIRKVALNEMKTMLAKEMGLDVDDEALRNYINSIRLYFSSEKRKKSGEKEGTNHKNTFYENLLFLLDHVGPFKCSYCQHTILSPLTLKAHESQHTGNMPFECPECKKQFKNVENYVFHMRRHMGDLNHACKLCGKRFLRLVEVKDHMRCHTGDKPFCCETCGASFTHRTGFARHKKVHTKKYVKFCPYCSKGFYTKDGMMKHIVVHQDDRNFMCSTCGKSFKTKTTLKSHVATHEDGNYECDICSKSFKNKINLWQHKRKHRLNSQMLCESPSPFDAKLYT